MFDYTDWPESDTPEATLWHEWQRENVRRDAGGMECDFDLIHGHFLYEKYRGLFASTNIMLFVRDPYQHAISTYEHAKRAESSLHPGFRQIVENEMDLVEFIESFPNHQSVYMRGLELVDLCMVGVTERYAQSVRLFSSIFKCDLPKNAEPHNVSPSKSGAAYLISEDVRRAVDTHRAEDIRLYRRATEYFSTLTFKYDI